MIGASLATWYGSNGTGISGSKNWFVYAAPYRVGTAHTSRACEPFHTLSLRTSDRLDCAANAKII